MGAPYPTLTDKNSSEGLHILLIYVNDVTGGLFTPMLLFAIFSVVCLGSFFATQRITGRDDMAVSFAVAGYLTTGIAFTLFLIDGIVNLGTVVITLSISAVGTLWVFFSR